MRSSNSKILSNNINEVLFYAFRRITWGIIFNSAYSRITGKEKIEKPTLHINWPAHVCIVCMHLCMCMCERKDSSKDACGCVYTLMPVLFVARLHALTYSFYLHACPVTPTSSVKEHFSSRTITFLCISDRWTRWDEGIL